MEITVVIGVRPHYIKASGLQHILKQEDISLMFLDVHQHYDKYLREIYVKEGNLSVLYKSEPVKYIDDRLEELVRQMKDVRNWLTSEEGKKSKAIIVFGDANPALASSIVANRLDVPVIHIEAGVRRIKNEMEHWNSLITDQLSSLRYCYTPKNVMDLQREGLQEGSFLVGDLFANWTIKRANESSLPIMIKDYVLVSIHRPQNCQKYVFNNICKVLAKIKKRVVWIMHPRTDSFKQLVEENENFYAIFSQAHSDTLALINNAYFILTDSGGLVREGVLLERKVIVCHEQGMWVDLVRSGSIIRTDNDQDSIEKAVEYVINNELPSGKGYFKIEGGELLFKKTLLNFLKTI